MIGNSGSGSSKDVSVPRIDIGQARLDTCIEEHSDILSEIGFLCDSPKVGRLHQIHKGRRCTSGGTISEAVSQMADFTEGGDSRWASIASLSYAKTRWVPRQAGHDEDLERSFAGQDLCDSEVTQGLTYCRHRRRCGPVRESCPRFGPAASKSIRQTGARPMRYRGCLWQTVWIA